MISLQKIYFHYPKGDFTLSIDGLDVAHGEKVGVVGPSGSGKTTVLNLIAGILLPKKGSVKIGSVEVSSIADKSRRDFRIKNIGFIFQDFGLLDYLNAWDNILHPYRITRSLFLTEEVKGRAVVIAETMGIAAKIKRYPQNLSHGEKQRVAICRALLPGPQIILADEATGNLDPKNKVRILELLFHAVQEHDATLIAVTHDQELLSSFDRVINFNEFIAGDTL